MSERFLGENLDRNQIAQIEMYRSLLYRAESGGADALSLQERERLAESGRHYLEVEKNTYEAMLAFDAIQDFEGLRKVADQLRQQWSNHYDLLHVLTLLEDHESIRNLLNKGLKVDSFTYENAFRALNKELSAHTDKFLHENGTPVATGGINVGIDLIAISNLSREYDVAVPIARGGLNQGAIAHLWGMPTRIVDIAAHNRKVPKGQWVNPVTPRDFDGKHVLLFDKDAVTGASVRKALNMLARFQTASISIYFTHNVISKGRLGQGTITGGLPLGLKIFCPNNAPMQNAGDIYIEAHEKLETLYGRRRLIEHLFTEEAQKLQEQFPDLSESLKKFASQQLRVFDSLNPLLPGISEVRENILKRLDVIFKNHADLLKNNMYSLPGVLEKFKNMLTTMHPLPDGFEAELVEARYKKKAEEAAQKRNVENSHYPSNPLAAFHVAQMAVKKGFDIAIIVGPEGFAYEPYFRDFGVPTVAVNIPESREGEPRTIKLIDDLSVLRGKSVLVVEDDVRTGATLQKLLEHLKPHAPERIGLYLGQPEGFQKTANIPPGFEETFIAETNASSSTAGKEFRAYLESRGLRIFKTTKVDMLN